MRSVDMTKSFGYT